MTNSKSVDPDHNRENVNAALIDKWLFELKTSFSEKTIKNEELIAQLIKRIDLLEAANTAKDKEIEALKKTSPNPVAFDDAAFWSKLPSAATKAISNIASKETCNIQNREKNLIISGVTESAATSITEKHEADYKKVVELLGKLDSDYTETNAKNYLKIVRLKPKAETNKPGLILVSFNETEHRNSLLKSAKKLKDMVGCRDVYINCDLTNAPLDMEKKLRTERNEKNKNLKFAGENGLRYGKQTRSDGKESKFYWGVRSGELKKITFA
jgi:methionine synthase II (cobalamin-independent)